MKKYNLKILMPVLLLACLVLIGGSCSGGGNGGENGNGGEGEGGLLACPELKCSGEVTKDLVSGMSPTMQSPLLSNCSKIECRTQASWDSVVSHYQNEYTSLGWEKSGGENIYYTKGRRLFIFYFGASEETGYSGYKLECCDYAE